MIVSWDAMLIAGSILAVAIVIFYRWSQKESTSQRIYDDNNEEED